MIKSDSIESLFMMNISPYEAMLDTFNKEGVPSFTQAESGWISKPKYRFSMCPLNVDFARRFQR